MIHIHTFIIFQVLFPYRFSQNTEQSSLCYIGGPCWLSIWYSVVCMLIQIFQFHQLSTPEEYSVVEDQKGFWRWWVGQVKQSIQLNLNFRQVSNKFFSLCPMHHWQYFLFAKPGNSGNCCCCSATKQLFATLDFSTPGLPGLSCLSLPILAYLLEFAKTHVHQVNDAIQLSHPQSPPSPPALNPSQHKVLSNEIALRIGWPKYWSFIFSSVLPINIQSSFPLGLTGLISLQSKGLWRIFFAIWRHKSFGAQSSSWFNSHIHPWLMEKPKDSTDFGQQSNVSVFSYAV